MAARNEMPASELPPSESEAQKKPELRLVAREMTPEQADAELGEMGKNAEQTADQSTRDMAVAAKEMNEMGLKYGAGLTAEESNDNNAIVAKAESAAATLRAEVAAVTGSAALEADLRSIDQQLEDAHKRGDGAALKALEARREQVDGERKKLMAAEKAAPAKKEATESLVPELDEAAPASGERATKAEAKVVVNFDDLLTTLSPEARKMASDNFANADEESYGGMVSKQMTPDGVVRVGYKDGTIVETFPGGQKRSNRPEATGAERIPELPAYLQEAEPMYPGVSADELASIDSADLLVLEGDLEGDKNELAAAIDDTRKQELQSRIAATEASIARKNTPEGLASGIVALDSRLAEVQLEMNAAPQEERGMHQQRIDMINGQKAELQRRIELSAAAVVAAEAASEAQAEADKAAAEKAERQKQILALEAKMRDLEKQYEDAKKASDPDKKAAIERELETTTREWDRLRAEDKKAETKDAAVEAKAGDANADAANAKNAVAAAEAAPVASAAKAKKEKQGPPAVDGSKPYEGGGGKKQDEKSNLVEKFSEAWGWAEKFFGGWVKK